MANSLTAYNPQWWANESVVTLIENLVAARLIHMDFSPLVARQGEYVNTRKPAEFEAVRKGINDDVTVQDATATNIQVQLNQLWHTSFLLRDGELSKSFKDLRAEYLGPAIISIAQAMDKVVLGQWPRFLSNAEGKAGNFSESTSKGYLVDMYRRFNVNKVPLGRRNMLLNPTMDAEAIKTDTFHEVDKSGSLSGLQEAFLGRKFGFDNYMVQNLPSIAVTEDATASTALVDNAGGYAKGATTIHMDTAGASLAAGQFITFGDEGVWHQITAVANLVTQDVDITIDPPLRRAVADDDTCSVGPIGAVNLAAGYAAGYDGELVVDGLTGDQFPVGSVVSTAAGDKYAVVARTLSSGNTIGITLDRPLAAALADDAVINGIGDTELGFAFDRNAMTLVSRPLALTDSRFGTEQAVASYNGFGLRVAMTYDPYKQGTLITVDVLAGIQVLDSARGGPLFG